MEQQTAVEWFWRWQMDNPFADFKEAVEAYKQAKQIEQDSIDKLKNRISELEEIIEKWEILNHFDIVK